MDWRSVRFDWNQARAVLVTAEEGSLSRAAKALGLTQPTLGRQVAALEEALGVTLFQRAGRTLTPTPAALDLIEHFRTMGEAAGRISLAASGRAQAIEGKVTISAHEMLALHQLIPVIERLRTIAPGIVIDVVTSAAISDLTRREADIALRHVRPDQPDLIARQLSTQTAYIYAATSYLERMGRPQSLEDLARFEIFGYVDPDRMLAFLNRKGIPLTRANVPLTSPSDILIWRLVQRGLALGMNDAAIGDATPGVERVLPDLFSVTFPIWLVTHKELKTSRRIRLVFDTLAEMLGKG